jgi:hypothetical protein
MPHEMFVEMAMEIFHCILETEWMGTSDSKDFDAKVY